MIDFSIKQHSSLILGILLIFSSYSYARQPETDQSYAMHFQQAEQAMAAFEFEQSIEQCKQALRYRPDDYLIRAIMCLNFYEIAEQKNVNDPKQKQEKINIYEKMAQIAEQGIHAHPDKGECYFFRGLAHARLSTTNGIIYSLFMAKGIELDWIKAVHSKSEYVSPTGENLLASSHLALGSYYRLCPSFFLLTWLFGISGDLDKSIAHLELAYDIDPRIEVTKEYGVSLITRGLARHDDRDIDQGRNLLTMVPSLPMKLKTDPVDIEHSQRLLNNMNLCPGYSRDQQQELSEAAFREARIN